MSKHNTCYTFAKNSISQTEQLIAVGTGTRCRGREVQFTLYFICFKCDNFRASKDAYHSSSLSDMATIPVSPGQDDVFWNEIQNEEQPPKVCEMLRVWHCLSSVPCSVYIHPLWLYEAE